MVGIEQIKPRISRGVFSRPKSQPTEYLAIIRVGETKFTLRREGVGWVRNFGLLPGALRWRKSTVNQVFTW